MKYNELPPMGGAASESDKDAQTPAEKKLSAADFTLLDPTEFQSYFKIGSRTEFRWRMQNTFPHIKIRGRIYYAFSDILEGLEKFKQKDGIDEGEMTSGQQP